MRQHLVLSRFFARSCLSILALLLAFPAAADNRQIILGTGVETGVYYPVGGTICRFINRKLKDHGLRCLVESTGGSLTNLNALREGEIQAGLAQSDLQYNAYRGSGVFADAGEFDGLRSLFSLHSESFTVVARNDSGINNFDQLRGRRVNIGNPGSGVRATMNELMRVKGWTPSVFRSATEFRASEQTRHLCDNSYDAFVFATGHPNGSMQEVAATCPSHLVPVSDQSVAALTARYPYYTPATIPGGMYPGNPSDTPTFGVKATVVSTTDVPDEVVYEMVKAVFDNFDDFKTTHPILSTLDQRSMIANGLTAPLHEGAKRYYREAGLLQ